MKRLRFYVIAACIATLAAGCSSARSYSPFGLPSGPPQNSLRGPTGDTVTEYTIPRRLFRLPKTFPIGITLGPDATMWFAERGLGRLGSITTDGQFAGKGGKGFKLTGLARQPQTVTTGPDGNLWATAGSTRRYSQESRGVPDPYGAIVAMTRYGIVSSVTPLPMYSDPRTITSGPDGNIWFAETSGFIGRIRLSDGKLKEFKIPNHNKAYGITAGPDGNLWFAETFNDQLGQITTKGKITLFPCPSPAVVVVGPDKKTLWVSEFLTHRVAQVTTAGTILQEVELPAGSSPKGIAVGGDGNLYVADFGTGKIAVVNPSAGTLLAKIEPPTHHSGPWIVAADGDGNIWFTESLSGKIGKITISSK